MEFLDINLTKDSSLLLYAIHSPFHWGIERNPYSSLVLKIITKNKKNSSLFSRMAIWGDPSSEKTRVYVQRSQLNMPFKNSISVLGIRWTPRKCMIIPGIWLPQYRCQCVPFFAAVVSPKRYFFIYNSTNTNTNSKRDFHEVKQYIILKEWTKNYGSFTFWNHQPCIYYTFTVEMISQPALLHPWRVLL